jgi:GMP synthase (glutamine-hydrolysing)
MLRLTGRPADMKPFLILQLRPEDEASDNEYEAFLKAGGLSAGQTRRIRMERDGIPPLKLADYSGIIVGGGPYCVSDTVKPPEQLNFEYRLGELLNDVIAQDFPYLGACYGIGILAHVLGGEVSKDRYSEGVGAVIVRLTDDGRKDRLLETVTDEFRAFGGHKEASQSLPETAVLLASSTTCPIQVIRVGRNVYATQFHAELDSAGLAVRINVYRNAGYFPPQEADQLIALTAKEQVTEPEKILRRFVELYSTACTEL